MLGQIVAQEKESPEKNYKWLLQECILPAKINDTVIAVRYVSCYRIGINI